MGNPSIISSSIARRAASASWNAIFSRFQLSLVMPNRVADFLPTGGQGQLSKCGRMEDGASLPYVEPMEGIS
jgi:hypothetical protein